MKDRIIILILLSITLAGCKTRKAAAHKQSVSEQSVVRKDSIREVKFVDTTKTLVKESWFSVDTGTAIIKIYPASGAPVLLGPDQTFSGRADSIVINKKNFKVQYLGRSTAQEKGIDSLATANVKTIARRTIKTEVKAKTVESIPPAGLVTGCAVLMALIGIMLYILYKLKS